MMTEAGTITAVDGDHATIRMDEAGCGRCGEPGGCGGNIHGKLFCSTPRTFRVPNPDHRAVGRACRLACPRLGSAQRRTCLCFSLLMLLAGALTGSACAGEAGAIAGAIAGLFVGWLGLRRVQRRSRRDPRLQPSIRP
ncbi:MAG: SoxR reducing system RseC family protein [Candidatus Accumulibacter sp.]|uniref:SoxR reducing system RseC family protein n=1 Tax=Candidatus Accumulibacter proximus TaxID=2954385 RepID=A0A935Q1V4_9PROT|nr:SoxR reducing system RseC family protein [Candidatus Accumulibacter proximus]